MNQTTFSIFNCFFDKIKNLSRDLIIWIKQFLLITVKPVESQILDTYRLPMIWYLSPCTIDDVSNFITCHKFKVLCCQFIAYEESIFDFYCSDQIRVHYLLLIVVHRLSLRNDNIVKLYDFLICCFLLNVDETIFRRNL